MIPTDSTDRLIDRRMDGQQTDRWPDKSQKLVLQGESVSKKVRQGTCLPFNFLTFKKMGPKMPCLFLNFKKMGLKMPAFLNF